MTAYEFDPKSVYRTQESLSDAVVHMSHVVEQPLRRAQLPEMPAGVRGQVQTGIAEAIALMSTAKSSIANVAREMKQKTYDLVEHKQLSNELGWGWKVGDVLFVHAPAFTGTDIIHKAIHHDEYGWKGVAGSGVAFGTNFVPVGKIFGAVSDGGKAAVGVVRGSKAANEARVAAQLERAGAAGGMQIHRPGAGLAALANGVRSGADDATAGVAGLAHAGDASTVSRHIGSFETTLAEQSKKWRWSGGHLDEALNANHVVVAAGAVDQAGVRWMNVATRDVLNPAKVTQQWKTFFPEHWTSETVMAAAARYPGSTGGVPRVGQHLGVKFEIVRGGKGELLTLYPLSAKPKPTWVPTP